MSLQFLPLHQKVIMTIVDIYLAGRFSLNGRENQKYFDNFCNTVKNYLKYRLDIKERKEFFLLFYANFLI